MKRMFQILCIILSASWGSSSISGISYIDPLNPRPLSSKPLPGEDPCNPLYWYPRQIPEYCYTKNKIPNKPNPIIIPTPRPMVPMPMPPNAIPVPYPMPYPMPMFPSVPQFVPLPVPQFVPPPVPQFVPPPGPQFVPQPVPQFVPPPVPQFLPPPQIPSVLPQGPINPMIPAPGSYWPYTGYENYLPQQAGLVPGIPGIVSQDGGINILPFSDAYSDMLEKHKQKIIRKRLQKVLDDYKDYPRKYRKHKRRYY